MRWLAAVAIVLAAAGCSSPLQRTTDVWVHYDGLELAFDHPLSWVERRQEFIEGSFGGPILVLSTAPPADTLCYQRRIGGSLEQSCDTRRLGPLGAGNLVLVVDWYGTPVAPVRPTPSMVVDGHPAWILPSGPDFCPPSLKATDDMVIDISRTRSSGIVESACARDAPNFESLFRRLISTIRVKGG